MHVSDYLYAAKCSAHLRIHACCQLLPLPPQVLVLVQEAAACAVVQQTCIWLCAGCEVVQLNMCSSRLLLGTRYSSDPGDVGWQQNLSVCIMAAKPSSRSSYLG
jgi:hypothetical protein